ncbi:MAG: ATP-binding cassette domain-containing protein [Candidatus Krumholzibacteria bacterium]|nr:ATP-binding cassette domain-containing protein [Candidatus Krumholzibacteria bacterium]
MIELENITVSLPQGARQASRILKNVTVTIEDGEWLVLSGANGSGKTTLLKTIAGLIPADNGKLNTEFANQPPSDSPIALLLQEPDNQFVAGSVKSELILSLPPSLGDEEGRQKLLQIIEQFSLGELLECNPHRLSGGEKQRLAFATVVLSEPRLLLLDEPTSYLDSVERERCTRFVQDLHRSGVSIVWAVPSVNEAPHRGRILHLVAGRVDFDGNVAQLRARLKPATQSQEDPLIEYPVIGKTLSSATPVVSLRSVSFAYGERPVFDGLSVDLWEGQCVGITGRNGSGKSTLLALLSGVLEATDGEVIRKYPKTVEQGRQNIFYLFQNPERLFFAETVFEEIAFGLRALKIPKSEIKDRVDFALTRVGLIPQDFVSRLPFSLSLGEMRRLAFAIALALDPCFLLLDEPASCLDDTGQSILLNLLCHFKREGCTIAIASHDTTGFSSIVDRLIEL